MRYPVEHKAETHERIVRRAAREFRKGGSQGIGIAKLMSRLGLTHGGFYAHFKNKDGLITEATTCMFQEGLDRMKQAVAKARPGHEVKAIIDTYLSSTHRDHPEAGCMLPSLTADVARRSQGVRNAFTALLRRYAGAIARYMPGSTEEDRMKNALVLLSCMAGAVAMARAVSDPKLSDEILRDARRGLVKTFSRPA